MTTSAPRTVFGSLDNFHKGGIEVTEGDARHYVFSNVFEVAASSVHFKR